MPRLTTQMATPIPLSKPGGEVRINQDVQIVQQESSLVWCDARRLSKQFPAHVSVGQNMGNLRCVGADRKRLGALQMKIFSHITSRRNRRTIVAVFEVKKEIP